MPPLSRRAVVVSVSSVSLALVAVLHLYVIAASFLRSIYAPSPDRLGFSTTHHVVDLASSCAFLVSVACCALLLARFVRSGRPALMRSPSGLWVGATIGALIAAAALCAEVWAAVVDYNWSYRDYQAHGDLGALVMDFIGVYALSFPLLAPVGCMWFERLDA